jgi:hypothetical protein
MSIASKKITLTSPELGLIAITRAALGIGIGLLISDSLEKEARRAARFARLAYDRADSFAGP